MPFTIEATEAKQVIDIEAGVYQAVVEGVEPDSGSFGEQIRFVFEVDGKVDGDGQPLKLWAWASQKLNPRTKSWKWVKAITGREPVKGQVYDLEALTGNRCGLLVVREETDEGVRCKVRDVLPAKQAHPLEESADDRCVECFAPLTYFSADGKAYCDEHGPRKVQQ